VYRFSKHAHNYLPVDPNPPSPLHTSHEMRV
jgi:hypothetical protein